MPCEQCTPLLAHREEQPPLPRASLEAVFLVECEGIERIDSACTWLVGALRCRQCGQAARFESFSSRDAVNNVFPQ